jgi:hypothetical protein
MNLCALGSGQLSAVVLVGLRGCLQISWAATGADVQNDFSGNVVMQSRHVRGRAFCERKDCAHDGGELATDFGFLARSSVGTATYSAAAPLWKKSIKP